MKKTISLLFFLSFFIVFIATASEMTGGDYSIEISSTTSGGGRIEESISQFTLWGALSQPTSVGKIDGSGNAHLFSGVYTAVIPEPISIALFSIFSILFLRRK